MATAKKGLRFNFWKVWFVWFSTIFFMSLILIPAMKGSDYFENEIQKELYYNYLQPFRLTLPDTLQKSWTDALYYGSSRDEIIKENNLQNYVVMAADELVGKQRIFLTVLKFGFWPLLVLGLAGVLFWLSYCIWKPIKWIVKKKFIASELGKMAVLTVSLLAIGVAFKLSPNNVNDPLKEQRIAGIPDAVRQGGINSDRIIKPAVIPSRSSLPESAAPLRSQYISDAAQLQLQIIPNTLVRG